MKSVNCIDFVIVVMNLLMISYL